MEALMHKVVHQTLGSFVSVDTDNVKCDLSSGEVSLRKAKLRPEVFDGIHMPITPRGGYIDEMSLKFDVGMFSSGAAKVVINNCFLVFGPQSCDWSWDSVYEGKSKLVDLLMKVYSLKPLAKKKKKKKGGWLADMQQAMVMNFAQKFLGLLEVQISNIHVRYEDAETQKRPFACGFKIGSVQVASDAKQQKDLRSTGWWNGSSKELLDKLEKDLMFFCQRIATRRISAYWDIGKRGQITGPTEGEQVKTMFCRLNRREIFSTCVVEKILSIFPSDHKRRKFFEGPVFRERLDFHQFVVFPSGLDAHVTVNKTCDTTRKQLAPLKDANVIVEPLEVAVDSEQIRSMNELLSMVLRFQTRDTSFRTRPQEPISKYLPVATGPASPDRSSGFKPFLPRGRSGSTDADGELLRASMQSQSRFGYPSHRGVHAGHSSASGSHSPPQPHADPAAQARKQLVRQWWHHAFAAVRLTCKIPRSSLTPEELRERCKLRENFVTLCIQEMDLLEAESSGQNASLDRPAIHEVTSQLRRLQMKLPMQEILAWRLAARQRRHDAMQDDDTDNAVDEEEKKALEEMERRQKIPSTMQACVHFKGFQAYFLIVVNNSWQHAMGKRLEERARAAAQAGEAQPASTSKTAMMRLLHQVAARQVVVAASVLAVDAEAVQKGRVAHRVGRWVELRIGSVSVTNCNVTEPKHATRHILSINPFEKIGGAPVCIFLGATMLEQSDSTVEPDDIPVCSVLEPWSGTAGHLREVTGPEEESALERLGFLREHVDKEGRVLTSIFCRCGQVRALDYTPFRRRMISFLTRGMSSNTTDLLRRPSPLAMDRELLVKLQRRVQLLTGKSASMGIVEGVCDGLRARMVDLYNSQHVICKEVSLAPLRVKALHNGNPQTFSMQLHQLLKSGDGQQQLASAMPGAGSKFGLLPWKVAMLLLPKTDFVMGLDNLEKTLREDAHGKAGSKHAASMLLANNDASNGSQSNSIDPALAVLEGTTFSKWGKNGKPQKRFVVFLEEHDVIVWKKSESDSKIIGVIPLASVQDIAVGLTTPVLQKARQHPKLRGDRLLSVIAVDRTLDLQADSSEQLQRWLQGLKERFKMHVQNLMHSEEDAIAILPKHLLKKQKKYPEKFRSDRCALRSSYRMVQANAALGRLLKAPAGGPELPGASVSAGFTESL